MITTISSRLDLTKAVVTTDSNPFVASASTTTPGAASSAAPAASQGVTPTGVAGSSGSSSSGSSSSSGAVTENTIKAYQQAHGIIMASTIVVILPLGAIIMRLFGGVWLHAAIQLFSLCAIIAGFGIGIRLAQMIGVLYNTAHTIFGTVIVVLFLFQPIFGLLHHRQYQQVGHRSYFGHLHIWYGRILLILGVVNGGLGLKLAANSMKGEIAYGVIVGVIALLYIAVVLFTGLSKRNSGRVGAEKSGLPGREL